MRIGSGFCATVLALGVFCGPVLAASDESEVLTPKARYMAAEGFRKAADGDAAFAEMAGLAAEGYAPALEKLGYYHARGVGTEVDAAEAARFYEAAIASGRDKSRTGYAKLLVAEGRFAEALVQLQAAEVAGVASAAPVLAELHYFGKMGDLSEAALGKAGLERAARAGHVRSMGIVFQEGRKGASFALEGPALQAGLAAVARSDHRNGGRAAEALVKGLRGDASAHDLRAEMLAHPLLREKVRVEEALWLASEQTRGRAFWRAADEIVADADPASFGRALYIVSRIDKNAYVHVLQREMADRGYSVGRQTGILNTRTLRAVTRFCAEREITRTCRYGPMRARVIKEITAELAAVPAAGQRVENP